MPAMSPFAETILNQKYAHDLPDGSKETWADIARRVPETVMKAVHAKKSLVREVTEAIEQRKFIPGGRYLYATGRQYHQVQNCLLLSVEDSREGWSDLLQKSSLALMTGAGIGVGYSAIRGKGRAIRKTGGIATGPIALMQMLNEVGRGVRQGGSRRSAIWAGLSWKHPDIIEFIQLKNWIEEVRALKERDFNFPAPMDGTNISVQLDDDFFAAMNDDKHTLNTHANLVYWTTLRQMLKTAEPGFSIDVGKNSKETLRNACVPGDTEILTDSGYVAIDQCLESPVKVWNGREWSRVQPKLTGRDQPLVEVQLSSGQSLTCTPDHEFVLTVGYSGEVIKKKAYQLEDGDRLAKFDYPVVEGGTDYCHAYAQGFWSAEGMDGYGFTHLYEPKYGCSKRLLDSCTIAGHSEKYNRSVLRPQFDVRSKQFVPKCDWSVKSRLDWLAGLADGDGTVLKEGGIQIGSVDRQFLVRTAKMLTTLGVASKVTLGIKAGVREMPNGRGGTAQYPCQDFYRLLICSSDVQSLIGLGLQCSRLLLEGFTPNRNASRFITVTSVEEAGEAAMVYCFNEPLNHTGCFDGVVTGQCTEVTSPDDSDICNLGSVNMANVESLEEMHRLVEIGTAFLLAGTVYSDVPYPKVDQIRTKNRRLGLGLMGIHEWLLKNGKKYGPDDDLERYLKVYAQSTKLAATYADEWELSRPVKTRAIAPNGTIGIVAETTTGIEPIFCVAIKRRYLKHLSWNYQYVVDPTAHRLIESGISPDTIEDAYSLATNVERRVEFQHWVQKYVDHGISSTINLPAWGSEVNNDNKVRPFGEMLLKYLPGLRGLTCYPDGARGGQPLTPVRYQTAVQHVGNVYQETVDICDITKGGSCGN